MASNRQELRRYDLEAWVHVNFYKAAVLYSFLHAAFLAYYLLSGDPLSRQAVRVSTVIYWALLTPSFNELLKGFLMIFSRGSAMSHIAENIRARLEERHRTRARLAVAALYAGLALWAAGLIAFLARW